MHRSRWRSGVAMPKEVHVSYVLSGVTSGAIGTPVAQSGNRCYPALDAWATKEQESLKGEQLHGSLLLLYNPGAQSISCLPRPQSQAQAWDRISSKPGVSCSVLVLQKS